MGYISNTPDFKIGDIVELTREVEAIAGRFTKGSIVKIIDIDSTRGYGFTDSKGNRVIECGWDCCKFTDKQLE